MTDFALLVESETYRDSLLHSELARGHRDCHERLEKALFLARRVGFLRKQSRFYHGSVSKTSDKAERLVLRAAAEEAEKSAAEVACRLSAIDLTFGNVMVSVDQEKNVSCTTTWLRIASQLSQARYLQWRRNLLDSEQAFATFFGNDLEKAIQEENISLSNVPVLLMLPPTEFSLTRFRYCFNPNRQIESATYTTLINLVRASYSSLTMRRLDAKCIPMSANRSTVFSFPGSEEIILVQISCEGDFAMRRYNIRLEKHLRTRLASSPFPSSILIETYPGIEHLSRASLTTEVVDASEENLNNKELRDAIQGKDVARFIEEAEDYLEKRSFLDGYSVGVLDVEGFKLLQHQIDADLSKVYPSVQYPNLHRWFRTLQCEAESAPQNTSV